GGVVGHAVDRDVGGGARRAAVAHDEQPSAGVEGLGQGGAAGDDAIGVVREESLLRGHALAALAQNSVAQGGRFSHDVPSRSSASPLVPKLCLGTPSAKLCFAARGRADVIAVREAELPDVRSQAELGNEEEWLFSFPNVFRRRSRRRRLPRRKPSSPPTEFVACIACRTPDNRAASSAL